MMNSKIAEIFEEIADMLELDEVDRKFEVLAYRKAAQTIEGLQEPVEDVYARGGLEALQELPGIGKSTSSHIEEYIKTGRIKKYDELKKKFPVDFNTLTKIPGLGAKKAAKLFVALKVKDIDDLKKALERHKIKDLEGFGERSEEVILKGVQQYESSKGRMLLGRALPEAERIIKKIKDSGLVHEVVIGGSTRRRKETVGDLDILVTSDKPEKVMDFISKMHEVESVALKGPTKTTVRLMIGLSCDVRVVEDDSFGAALQYFTGNKEHNVRMREIAIGKGLKLNEYGLFDKKDRNISKDGEEDIYKKLGLDWMPPEMRENRGEIELAMKHKLPKLIELDEIKGDLHTHTIASDGSYSIVEMATAAKKLGREYIGISDHSKSEYIARGMDDRKFAKHLSDIDKANDAVQGIRILKGAEIDILKDGSLDLSGKTMELMDYTLASIHTNLSMPKEEMTKRIIAAFDSGYVDIWAHPTDRLINARGPISVDFDRVFEAAERNNVVMEIDSFPDRLDLSDENIFKARKYKLRFCIDTDSHSTEHLSFMRFGIGIARRGWLTKEDVVNTMNAKELLSFLGK
ncbi:MAG: DNA polymerase/3'-5' exonuclease PolX [Candidatus Micrarchaeota archaeon]|nr:DNA polymerase/3'-5' exonuclease PolX [Candidatus Micrarchaeota archaeon]